MPEIPKLAPEVELPRPRSSGVAVVAVAALAMFTAVGASAFIVRVRMGMSPCTSHRSSGGDGMLDRAAAARLDLIEAFVTAVADEDDRAALNLYQQIPDELDPTRRLARMRQAVISRQMLLLQGEMARGACKELRQHEAWLRQAAPDEPLSVIDSDCAESRPPIMVELVPR